MWIFGKGYVRNVVIFDVVNISSPNSDHHKNIFFLLGEANAFNIKGSFAVRKKSFVLTLPRQRQNFA